jgi:hypothetical protein
MKYLAVLAALAPFAALADPNPADWDAVVAEAEGDRRTPTTLLHGSGSACRRIMALRLSM